MLGMIALAALPGNALLAQSLTGTWQGTMQIPSGELRTVFKISTTDADKLKAVLIAFRPARDADIRGGHAARFGGEDFDRRNRDF